jgi:hypothetical protein
MSKNQEPKHVYHIISMDTNSPPNTPQEASTTIANINRALDDLKNKNQNCDKCGGIEPEISLWHNGADYRFVCVKITDLETGKDLRNTDYKQFCHYLMAKGYGPESAEDWIKWCDENNIT